MRFFSFLVLLCLFTGTANAQETRYNKKTVIYLVRHAEKKTGQDPVLTEKGMQRSGMLMRILFNEGISRVYVTQYRRTQLTADILVKNKLIDTVHYLADTSGNDLLKRINEKGDWGKKILVVGHSNTLPALIRKLGVADYLIKELPETEFDNLFLITYKKHKPGLQVKKYGEASGTSAKMQ